MKPSQPQSRLQSWRIALCFLGVIAFLSFDIGTVLAAGSPAGKIRSTQFRPNPANPLISFASLGQSTQTLTGLNPTYDVYVPVPGPGNFGSHTMVQIVYSRSPLVETRFSSVSLSVNGYALTGQYMSGNPSQPATLTAAIPPNFLVRSGFNHLQLSFTLRDRSRQECISSSTNLSVTVYGRSWLRYDLTHGAAGPFSPNLAALPDPFIASVGPSAPLVVGLPTIPTTAEFTAAGQILARFGEDSSANLPSVSTFGSRGLRFSARSGNLVLIGTPRDNAALAAVSVAAPIRLARKAWRDVHGRSIPAGEGIILEARNPWNPRRAVLIVSGNDDEGVRRAATLLSSGALRRLLHGSFALLPSAPRLPATGSTLAGSTSLAKWGFHTTTLEGLGEHDAHLSFDLQQAPAKDGSLDLVYARSATIASDLSSIRIDLNGQPVASQKLGGSSTGPTHWKVSLPADLLQIGTNVLNVRAFLDVPYTYCKPPTAGSVWASVSDRSSLSFTTGSDGASADLKLLPFPLVVNGSPGKTVLVVPEQVNQQHNALALAVLIGAQSNVDAPQLTVVGAGHAGSELLRTHTVVLDGLPRDNSMVRQVAPYLPLQAAPALSLSGDTSRLDATVRTAGQVGIVEEFVSPWNPGLLAVVLSATEPTLLAPIRQLAFAHQLSGTVATVDRRRAVQTFDTQLIAAHSVSGPSKRPIALLAAVGLLGLLLIAGVAAGQRLRTLGESS